MEAHRGVLHGIVSAHVADVLYVDHILDRQPVVVQLEVDSGRAAGSDPGNVKARCAWETVR